MAETKQKAHTNKNKLQKILSYQGLAILCMNLAVLAVCLIFFHPHFEEIDDLKMSYIVEGVYGVRDAHMVYTNYLIGLLLKGLYMIIPGIRWYTLYLYAGVFISFVVLTYLFTEKGVIVSGIKLHNPSSGRLVSMIFLLCFAYEGYVSLQYTKIAVMLSVAGYLLMFYALRDKRKRALAAGILLAWFGSLMRIDSFLLATAFMGGVGIFEIWHYVKALRQYKKRLIQYVGAFFVLFILVIGAKALDTAVYQQDAGWAEFLRFNEVRTQLNDYHYTILDTVSNGEQLKAAGISENDAYSYLTWQYGDTETFTAEYIETILQIPEPVRSVVDQCKALLSNLYEFLYSLNGFVLGGVCIILSVILLRQRHLYALLTYGLLIMAVSNIYYQFSGRWNHRVVMIVWFALLCILLHYLDRQPKRLLLFIIGICLFINAGLLLKDNFAYREYQRTYGLEADFLKDYTAVNKENLYIVDTFADQYSNQYKIMECLGEGTFSNRISTGGWLTGSPIEKSIMAQFGTTNPYRLLLEHPEKTFLVDKNNISNKVIYLNEHYKEQYGEIKEREIAIIKDQNIESGFSIYQMLTE